MIVVCLAVILVAIVLLSIYFVVNQSTYRVTKKELDTLPNSYKIVDDINLVDKDGEKIHLDYAVIGKPGIYLISIIDRKGVIVGDESQSKWRETIGNRVEEFNNPTFTNMKKMHLLRKEIEDFDGSIPIYPLAVFHKKADLNDLFSESLTIRANSISNYI